MKFVDSVLRILGAVVFIVGLGMPGRLSSLLGCIFALAVGVWGIIYPPGILGWAATARKEIDPMDKSGWSITRIISVLIILIATVIGISIARGWNSGPLVDPHD